MVRTIILLFLLTGCATKTKTLLYSGVSGAIVGSYAGYELSPDKESNTFNSVIGAGIGAALGAALGYYFYQDANPQIDLKISPLKNDSKLIPITDHSFGMDKIKLMPRLSPSSKKTYISVDSSAPKDVKRSLKRQFYKRYKTDAYEIEQNGHVYAIPSFEIIESGTE